MNPLTVAVLQSGLVERGLLEEVKRWGAPIEVPKSMLPFPNTAEEVVNRIEEALQSEGLVATRETDLEILRQYMATQRSGILYLETETQVAEIPIVYGKTPSGEYIIPWRSETMREELVNGLSYLQEGHDHVYFMDVRELFYGDVKAFMVCTSSRVEREQDDNSTS